VKVGDLVIRVHRSITLPHKKGIILSIRQVGGQTYYKIAWFFTDIVSNRWTDREFCPYRFFLNKL